MPKSKSKKKTTKVSSIVAIASSAGGLEATSLLAQNLPSDLNCCYVIAQHMSPSHKSMLVQLLSRETKLEVEELENRTVPKPNVVYIPQPGYDVVYADNEFQLREPSGHPASPKPSADRLFISLAEKLGEYAIGVVLSGTGSDGSYGVRAIRESGGITIAQEPATCKYDSMPAAAIRTGCVDLTLTPQQIGEHIGLVLVRPRNLSVLRELSENSSRHRDLFEILLSHTLVDFRQYKETTINRRIQRRMIAKGINDFDTYVDLCRRSVEEIDALYRDLLISVTRFFRDWEQFVELRESINEQFKDHPTAQPIRVWVAGCATGEEAYSIAILLAEALGGLDAISSDSIQIFATDIDEDALNVGRKGVYPYSAVADIPESLLHKYFDVKQDLVYLKPKLRHFVMFSRHNVFQDAPFISVDMVSIRNVMIYFNARLQERVLTRIVYALKPKGLLFLGTSETLGPMEGHFTQVSPNARLFQLRDQKVTSRTAHAAFRSLIHPNAYRPEHSHSSIRIADEWKNFDRLAASVVKDGMVINRERTVLRVYGDIAPFSELTAQSFGHSTLGILKKPLASDAASLALVALKRKEKRAGQWHPMPGNKTKVVQLTAYPMGAEGEVAEDLVLIGIEVDEQPDQALPESEKSEYVHYLEDELSRTRDALQVTIEQLQTSNEELQSVNEELQSSNEELQSTNEELETSNEELQSTNEELITVNEELLVNTSQLERTSAELNELVANTPTTLLMVDQGLVIRYASEQAIQALRLTERGVGYGHLSQVSLPDGFPALVDLSSQVLVSRKTAFQQFKIGKRLNRLAIAPIVAQDDHLIGLVLQVQSDNKLHLINEKLRKYGGVGTWRVNMATGETDYSEELAEIMGFSDDFQPLKFDQAMAASVHPDDLPRVLGILNDAAKNLSSFHYHMRIPRKDGSVYLAEVAGDALQDPETHETLLIGVLRNVSDAMNSELLLQHYNDIAKSHGIGFYSYDVLNDLPYWSPALYEIMGVDAQEGILAPTVQEGLAMFSEDTRAQFDDLFRAILSDKKAFERDDTITRSDRSRARVRITGNVIVNEADIVTHIYGSFELLEDLG